MKKIIAIIAALVLAIILTSCSGSSGTPASSTDTASSTTGTPAPQAASTSTPAPAKLAVPRKFISDKSTPRFFMEALKKKDPILLTFYNDDDLISKEVLAEIKSVYDKYNGTVTFLQLKSDLNEQVSSLAEQFHVGFVPYTAVINRNATIIFEKTGYLDSIVIEQAVYDAVNK